jgi:hypothetical protein
MIPRHAPPRPARAKEGKLRDRVGPKRSEIPTRGSRTKSMFMVGRKAGFDMTSPQGIEAWMRVVQSRMNAEWAETRPSLGARSRPVNSAAAREKKKQRKAVRKARKKNR